ncbi:hypothetical protein TTHERM_00348410 (macronuclear) [Tetrahymena thermophila SB210]|uniref:PH domain-containing protein n=1 Tax=Tetrahymena thermophila (strain SB210) TaxID=312017 RepID=I7MHA4_TETTS|nr:hypothetical protein TTHERM_00348410 [Tetrahymena thermophila SB210]EAS02751.3 hypothetical protein TTHERM_00348410 [Tetrahymena thermophila SB210]|eukprot:XP_001022996.3 hypothetical protein TTHERM_00348410 [Tetrahymena thermophila SB210]
MSKHFTNLNSSGANANPLTIATGSQIAVSQISPVSPYQSSHYYIPNSYDKISECFLNRNDGFSNKSSTISTVKEAPFYQPCQISVESEYNKVSQVIDNCFANDPVQKESLLNSLKTPNSLKNNNLSITQPKQVLQVSKKNNIVTPLDLAEKNLGNADYGKQFQTPVGQNKIQSQEQTIDLSTFQDSQKYNNGYKDSNQQLKRHSTSSNAEEINYSQAIPFDHDFAGNQISSNRSTQNQQLNQDMYAPQQNSNLDLQLQFECIKQNLEIQIQMLENRLLEVDLVRQKYFKMMIEDLKREKNREIFFIQSLIKQNNWDQSKNMKGIDSIKRKITDIGIEMNDLKDLKNVHTKYKPSIYYDPNRASKILNLRRSNSASQLLSYVRNKPLDLPEIIEIENQSQQEREILPASRLPFYQSKHFTDFKQADNPQEHKKYQNNDFYCQPSNSNITNQYLTPNKQSQVGYQTQQAEDQQNIYSYQTPTNLIIENNNSYYPQDLNAISSNKSQSSTTPYSMYADKQNDQKNWYNDNHKQDKEINLDQYKKVVPSYNRHQRNQSLYTQKSPYYENKNNQFTIEMCHNKINECQAQKTNSQQQIPSVQVQEILNNKDSQLDYKLNPPFNLEGKFTQPLPQNTSNDNNNNKIQADLEREQSQDEEDMIKRTPQNNFSNPNYPHDEKLEESLKSNRPWANIMNSQKKKLTESNHSSRYSACNEDSQKDQELESNQFNSIANIQQNYQEPKFYHCRKFNSDQKNNKSDINSVFLSNKKQDDHKDFTQNMPEIADLDENKTNFQYFYSQIQPEQNEQMFYHQKQNPEQLVKDYQIHNKHFENIIQSVKLNSPDGYQQGYFPSERVETARFENLNDIQSRKGLHSQTEFNFQSAQSIDRQHDNKHKSNQNQEIIQNQSYENLSIKQNTPTQSNKDFDSFAHENSFQNIQNQNNSLNNSKTFKDANIQAMNNSRDKSKCQTDQNELLQVQGENILFNYKCNPQPIQDLNSMISSQQKQDTQSFYISEQDPSMLFSTNNNNYLAQYQIDQSHTYVNQGESFFSEKDQIRVSQKKQYLQNQSRGQYDFENQSVRQENLPIIEEQLQNSDESQRSSQIHNNQQLQYFQDEAQNVQETKNNNLQIDNMYQQSINHQMNKSNNQSYENGTQQKVGVPIIDSRFEQKNNRIILNQYSDSDVENQYKNNASNQRGSQSNLAVSKQSVQNMENINKIIERHITIQSSTGSEIIKNAQQQNQIEKKFQDNRQLYQENQKSQNESSDKILTNTKTKEQTLNEQNEFQDHIQAQYIESRNITQQTQDQFFVGNVKARSFLTDREFREYLTDKSGTHSNKKGNEQSDNLTNSQRSEESKFAKCKLIYSFNNQCLKLTFDSSLLYSLDEEQTIIDEIPVCQINIDQLDFINLPQNKIYLKLSYKNQPSLNNKIILMQFGSATENCDYFTQKNHLENLKNKIQLIYQLKDDPEDLNSKLIINSQPVIQNYSQNALSSDVDIQNQRNGEGEQEESKSEIKYELDKEYIPSSKRLTQGNYNIQQQQQQNDIFSSVNNQESQSNNQQDYEKQKLRTPQFQEINCESQQNKYDNTLQSPIPFNQKDQNSFEQEKNITKENEQRQKQKCLAEIMEENSEQFQQKSASYCQNQKEKQEVQIFSGFSNHDSVLKQNVVDLSQRFFLNNQKQFSTIKRENEDEEVGDVSQDIENNIRQFNELNPNIEDYQEDQAEFSMSQIKDQKLKQKLLQYNKYKMAQYSQRTDEEENLLKILKNFDEKLFIMKKYGQNSTKGQLRRIFFSSDFRFFCWKGDKSPELKRSFPINKFQPYIIHGRNTENFKRFKTSNQMEKDLSFSLVLDDRTIDLQAKTIEEKEEFIKGLQIIFNCIL